MTSEKSLEEVPKAIEYLINRLDSLEALFKMMSEKNIEATSTKEWMDMDE
jgi:hypothetical protein